MPIVAVAGGLGDLGRLITDALLETGKHEVYVLSRKVMQNVPSRTSPLTGKPYHPMVHADYSEESLVEKLSELHIDVVISTLIMDSDSASDAQLRLIRAAERSPRVRRFIPSEYNVEYDVGDDVLPYPEKRYHLAARHELEQRTTSLEYFYIYPGMFMDYFGLPRVASSLRPLCFFIDPEQGLAVLPGDGEAKMSMTLTTDLARYVALSLDLQGDGAWPRVMTTAASTVSLNELVALVEKSLGRKLEVRYQPVENLRRHEDVIDLPTNLEIAKKFPERFPGGLEQLRALIADLEAGVALGAFDFGKLRGGDGNGNGNGDRDGHLDLVEAFGGRTPEPMRIERLIEEAWKATPN